MKPVGYLIRYITSNHIQQSVQNKSKDGEDDDDSPFGIGVDDPDLENEDAEAAMESLQINGTVDECNDVEDEDDEIFSKNCLKDVWYQGWDLLDKMKIKATKEREARRTKQKRLIQKTVLNKVREMKEAALSTVIIEEEMHDTIDSLWTSAVHRLQSNRYID